MREFIRYGRSSDHDLICRKTSSARHRHQPDDFLNLKIGGETMSMSRSSLKILMTDKNFSSLGASPLLFLTLIPFSRAFFLKTYKRHFSFMTYFQKERKRATRSVLRLHIHCSRPSLSWVIKLVVDHLKREGIQRDSLHAWSLGGYPSWSYFTFYQRYLLICASRDVEYQLRNDLFQVFQEQPKAFFRNIE